MEATAARAAYRVRGTTDEVTTCENCGRPELRGTVVLECLDLHGNVEELLYVGTGCAATLAKQTQREVRDEAKRADKAAEEARQAERNRRALARTASLADWVTATYGVQRPYWAPRDVPYVPDVPGMTPYGVVKAWEAAGRPGFEQEEAAR